MDLNKKKKKKTNDSLEGVGELSKKIQTKIDPPFY